MEPKKNLGLRQLLVLNSYWLGLSFMWNSLHPIVLPAVLLRYVPETQKNSYLGVLTFAGLVIATVVQPIAGGLSDRWASAWGRRRPLALAGTLGDLVCLAILAWAGGLPGLALGYLGLQLTSNGAHGPLQGLLPDQVPAEQMGRASGIKIVVDMSGLVAASLITGRLLRPDAGNAPQVIGLITAVLVVTGAVTLAGVREAPALARPAAGAGPVFTWAALRNHAAYWRLVFSRFLFLLGIMGVQSFAQYFVRDVLRPENPVQMTGDLMAAITLSLLAFTVVGGWAGDRWGHRATLLVASAVGAAGCGLLLWARTPATLLIAGGVVGIGAGLFLTSNWALANRLAPAGEAGMYLGLTNLATAGSGALGRLEGLPIDYFNNLTPGAFHGYNLLFIFSAACLLLSAAALPRDVGR